MKRLTAILALTLCATSAVPCGPDYCDFLVHGGRDVFGMPTAMFYWECRRLLLADGRTAESLDTYPDHYVDINETDTAELRAALGERADAATTLEVYTKFRGEFAPVSQQFLASWHVFMDVENLPKGTFDLAPYESMLTTLPKEFALYIRGSVAFVTGDYDNAIRHYETVLALPVGERMYRSTWSAYMLGKVWILKDPAQAPAYFQQTRTLATNGFRDPLQLAPSSEGWEAFAELRANSFGTAARKYMALAGDPTDSLRRVSERLLDQEVIPPESVNDPLLRSLATAYLLSFPDATDAAGRWLTAIESAKLEAPVDETERLAWLSYMHGDFEAAERWLAVSSPDRPFAKLVKAKLALRAGDFVAGEKLLAEAEPLLRDMNNEPAQEPLMDFGYYSFSASEAVAQDLGIVLAKNGAYAASLAALYRSRAEEDAIFVAERATTLDELKQFVDTLPVAPQPSTDDQTEYAGEDWGPRFRSILARRYARAGEWIKAGEYYPDSSEWNAWDSQDTAAELKQIAETIQADLQVTQATSADPKLRAEAYIRIATAIREHGPGLFNPSLDPRDGLMEIEGLTFSDDYTARIKSQMDSYPTLNHFKNVASEYLWKAAELLPDNDIACAKALYYGGVYIKGKDVARADQFYKALVRRNPNLAIAIEADTLRWFPEEFNETVVYQPLPKRWYGRRLYLVYALGLVSVLGMVVAGGMVLRKPKSASSGEGGSD